MSQAPRNWWEGFFTGIIADMWVAAVPEEQTRREVDFVTRMLGLSPGAKVLDAPCGAGRHSLLLAADGHRVTGVDASEEFIDRATRAAAQRGIDAAFLRQSVGEMTFDARFDGAVCLGNSFGYDDEEGNAAFLAAIARAIRPGGKFVLEAPMVAECLLMRFNARSWHEFGDLYFLEDERYDPRTGRVETTYTSLRGGEVRRQAASHRVYTCREVLVMLAAAGFVDIQLYGSLAGEPFTLGSQGMFVVATRG